MNFIEQQTCERMKNLAESLIQPTERNDEASQCETFLDLSPKDLKRYSLFRGIVARHDSITRGASNLGALRANRSTGNALGAHQALDERFQEVPGFGGLEGECHRALEKKLGPLSHGGQFYTPADYIYRAVRDLNVAQAAGGGFLVGTKNVSFIDSLRNASKVYQLGATRLPGQRENVTLPKQVGNSTVVWLSTETSTATESNSTFSQVSGTPKTASAYMEISDKLLRQSNPSAEGIAVGGLGADVGVGVDAAALNGSGVSGQPLGILGTAGIGAASGTTLGYTALVEVQTDLADNNTVLDQNSLGYLTTPSVASLLKSRQRFTSTDSPVWQGAVHAGMIEGVQALSSKNVPTATLVYGCWSSLVIAEWGTLIVELNPFANFQAGIVGVRCLWSVDVLVRQPLAFSAINSIT